MELNKVHNLDFLNNDLPDKCAKLIIADPPYYKTKGEFDFIWKTFEDYLVDVEKWCLECKRILADNGTLLWYGGSKNIAYAQIIFDKHFNLLNNLTWNKGSFMGLEQSEGLRSFAPCTERILMYTNQNDIWDSEINLMHEKESNFADIKEYLWNETDSLEMTWKEINRDLLFTTFEGGGGRAYNMLSRTRKRWDFPDKDNYLKLQKSGKFQRDYNELKIEYEVLRDEYEKTRRYFDNLFNLQEILNFSNEAAKTGNKYDHDTIKPETLTRALILTCSRKNDLIVVPFSGSGTEVAMSAKEKRPFIGYEITKKHADMSQARANKILTEPTMF
jgi:site-specific DNA-methyltransferase (adenine-specific)